MARHERSWYILVQHSPGVPAQISKERTISIDNNETKLLIRFKELVERLFDM